ncbi:hypothetical protein GDO78_000030 [Eleutherodactylus coqui]|uniref:Uncharacterized protein n=1 Tax=Eleutherodactylus coqui TaxID=57060 RepID=A0A8J6FPW3_ELECQ|nr:hypothetical protein GDO78_000030 [Eleutherodactylus coqui]
MTVVLVKRLLMVITRSSKELRVVNGSGARISKETTGCSRLKLKSEVTSWSNSRPSVKCGSHHTVQAAPKLRSHSPRLTYS